MKNRKVTLKEELERIILKCDVCNLSMVDGNLPYVIPMNFGYADDKIYFHSSKEGRKIDILRRNTNVCISFSTDHQLRYQSENVACSYSMKYRSVLAKGNVSFIDSMEEKEEALSIIMKNYSDLDFAFNMPAVRDVAVFVVNIETLEGRAYGY